MSWKHSENGEAVRPSEVDDTSSAAYVYVRKNIVLVPETDGRGSHYEWDELKVPKGSWELWERSTAALDSIAFREQAVATDNHAVGESVILDGTLYKVTVPIVRGESIREGINVTATTVAAEMLALQTGE